MAYVLIKTGAGRSKSLVEQFMTFEGVVVAFAAYGAADVVAEVDVSDGSALARLVMEKIQRILTQPLIVVEGMVPSPE